VQCPPLLAHYSQDNQAELFENDAPRRGTRISQRHVKEVESIAKIVINYVFVGSTNGAVQAVQLLETEF